LFRSTGHRDLNWLEKTLLSIALAARRALQPKVRLNDNGHRSVFVCDTKTDAQRPMALWLKEEGTMRWIDREVRAGDIFMDIGANIGVYTLAAAHRSGDTGRVYAFEPHKVNAVTLMQNVVQSGVQDRVEIFTSPLADEPRVL
jgi:predicted O-methyltransferase YrrM